MEVEDDVGPVRDLEPVLPALQALRDVLLKLLKEAGKVDHHSVTDLGRCILEVVVVLVVVAVAILVVVLVIIVVVLLSLDIILVVLGMILVV